MKKNMSQIDRAFRVLVACAIAALYFTGLISGTVAIGLGILATIFVLTSIVGTCPLYSLVGLSTSRSD